MELAPRDIVARAIQTEINEGRGFEGGYVHLDLRHLGQEKILKRLPGIRQICIDFGGIDPIEEPIPIQPGQHYSMGGIDTDVTGKTSVDELLRRRRMRLRQRARGQPAGRKLAAWTRSSSAAWRPRPSTPRRADFDFQPSRVLVEDRVRSQIDRVERLAGPAAAACRITRSATGCEAVLTEKVGIFRNETDLAEAVERDRPAQRAVPGGVAAERRPGRSTSRSSTCWNWRACSTWPRSPPAGPWPARRAAARTPAPTIPSATTPEWLKHTDRPELDGDEIRLLLHRRGPSSRIYEPQDERTY